MDTPKLSMRLHTQNLHLICLLETTYLASTWLLVAAPLTARGSEGRVSCHHPKVWLKHSEVRICTNQNCNSRLRDGRRSDFWKLFRAVQLCSPMGLTSQCKHTSSSYPAILPCCLYDCMPTQHLYHGIVHIVASGLCKCKTCLLWWFSSTISVVS